MGKKLDIKTKDMETALEARYRKDSSKCYLTELRMGTGYENEQRVDGFLMELWPSKGYEITVFEIKVSRSDFLTELRNPKKRECGFNISNYFYFVTANDLVKDESEIPDDCGWIVFDGESFITKREAPKRIKPEACPWTLMASVFRRAYQEVEFEKRIRREAAQAFSRFLDD